MKVLILGSTGMLGQSLITYFKKQGFIVHGVAHQHADYNLDLVKELHVLSNIIQQNEYDVIINTVALVNLDYCEQYPEQAYLVNTKIAGEIAKICNELNIYFIQISTDHYYTGDVKTLHNEDDSIVLLNEYAKTKYLAEKLVELYENTLIVRTNIVGYRNQKNLTFTEWIIKCIHNNELIFGYTDMYTSSIDVQSFANILGELICERTTGVLNVSADGVLSKYDFILLLSEKFGKSSLVQPSKLPNSSIVRGDSLGLSINKLRKLFPTIKVPTPLEVVNNLYEQYMTMNEEK